MADENLRIYAEALLSSRNNQSFVLTKEIQEFTAVLEGLRLTPSCFALLLLQNGSGLRISGSYADWFEIVAKSSNVVTWIQKLQLLDTGSEMKIQAETKPESKKRVTPEKDVRVKIDTWTITEKLRTEFKEQFASLASESWDSFLGKVMFLGLIAPRKGSKSRISTEYSIIEKYSYLGNEYVAELYLTTNKIWESHLERQARLGHIFTLHSRLKQFRIPSYGIQQLSHEQISWLLSMLPADENLFQHEAKLIFESSIYRTWGPGKRVRTDFPGGLEYLDELRHRIYGDDIN